MTTLADLIPDPKNARRRGPRAEGMIVKSLQEVGAARSIVYCELLWRTCDGKGSSLLLEGVRRYCLTASQGRTPMCGVRRIVQSSGVLGADEVLFEGLFRKEQHGQTETAASRRKRMYAVQVGSAIIRRSFRPSAYGRMGIQGGMSGLCSSTTARLGICSDSDRRTARTSAYGREALCSGPPCASDFGGTRNPAWCSERQTAVE